MEQSETQGTALQVGAQQGSKGIDAYWLKLIAIFGMTLDHIGIVFGPYLPLWAESALYALGGLTFPIMAYLLCEGFRHTRSKRNYALRLLGFGLLTQIPYMWALVPQLNIMFTLFLGVVVLCVLERVKSPTVCLLVVVGFTAVSMFFDWGIMCIPMVVLYYYMTDKRMKIVMPVIFPMLMIGLGSVSGIATGNFEALPQMLYVFIGCTLTVPLLARYNGQRGRSSKYLFYVYYPAHIIILGLLRGLLFKDWGKLF